jgi:hypothetical protein
LTGVTNLPPIDSTFDHAATLLVSEHTSALLAFRARLVVAIREPEDPDIEVDFVAGLIRVTWAAWLMDIDCSPSIR